MHLREIDMRIGPLHDVIVGIDAGIAAIGKRLNTEEGFDGISAQEHAESYSASALSLRKATRSGWCLT